MKRKNRDKAYRAIPKEQRGNFKRSSIRNQLLHPQYVEDYEQVTGKDFYPRTKDSVTKSTRLISLFCMNCQKGDFEEAKKDGDEINGTITKGCTTR